MYISIQDIIALIVLALFLFAVHALGSGFADAILESRNVI